MNEEEEEEEEKWVGWDWMRMRMSSLFRACDETSFFLASLSLIGRTSEGRICLTCGSFFPFLSCLTDRPT